MEGGRCKYCGTVHPPGVRVCSPSRRPAPYLSEEAGIFGPAAPAPVVSARFGPDAKRAHREQEQDLLAGKYRLKAVIGKGGSAQVFEAEHVALGKSVAIKVLDSRVARDATALARLHREAGALAALGHPNICDLYDIGNFEDGRPFVVMERLLGESLRERLARRGALRHRDAVELLLELLSGLATAHVAGFVHRDVKPENVFLVARPGMRPLAKLLDFGVARDAQNGARRITLTGNLVGTPSYMAPEQITGGRDVDARVDLWGAGALLYEVLAGAPPFHGANAAALVHQIVRSPHRSVLEMNPALPAGLAPIIDRALQKAPSDRYPSAIEFMEALTSFRDGPMPAEEPSEQELSPGIARGPSGLPYLGSFDTTSTRLSADERMPRFLDGRPRGQPEGRPPPSSATPPYRRR